MDIAPDLQPFFEFAYINCFALCSYCGTEQEFESAATPYSDQWYLDMAIAIKEAKWAIPRRQIGACAKCVALHALRHDANTFTKTCHE